MAHKQELVKAIKELSSFFSLENSLKYRFKKRILTRFSFTLHLRHLDLDAIAKLCLAHYGSSIKKKVTTVMVIILPKLPQNTPFFVSTVNKNKIQKSHCYPDKTSAFGPSIIIICHSFLLIKQSATDCCFSLRPINVASLVLKPITNEQYLQIVQNYFIFATNLPSGNFIKLMPFGFWDYILFSLRRYQLTKWHLCNSILDQNY